VPAREFVDGLDDRAAARIDAFIERLRSYGNQMQGKFVKKLTVYSNYESNSLTGFFGFSISTSPEC